VVNDVLVAEAHPVASASSSIPRRGIDTVPAVQPVTVSARRHRHRIMAPALTAATTPASTKAGRHPPTATAAGSSIPATRTPEDTAACLRPKAVPRLRDGRDRATARLHPGTTNAFLAPPTTHRRLQRAQTPDAAILPAAAADSIVPMPSAQAGPIRSAACPASQENSADAVQKVAATRPSRCSSSGSSWAISTLRLPSRNTGRTPTTVASSTHAMLAAVPPVIAPAPATFVKRWS
jgi:hypothetical protein